uniref:SH3 domain-containing protein n=1 Tax=Gongylonema pulchrum TaxID=637853 RepID=A0A183DG70_9BILA
LEHFAVPRSLSYDESATFRNSSSSSSTGFGGTSNSSSANETKQIYRVLYDFTATTDDELGVHAGDCVLVERRIGNDWLVGQIISNKQMENDAGGGAGATATGLEKKKIGRFPASYVASAHSI